MANTLKTHLRLVSNRSDPTALLTYLMMALCESHHLELDATMNKLQKLIIELKNDVAEKNMDHDEFNAMANFITRIANSDEKTINEFLQYVDKTTH